MTCRGRKPDHPQDDGPQGIRHGRVKRFYAAKASGSGAGDGSRSDGLFRANLVQGAGEGVVADAPGMAVTVRQTRRGAQGVQAPSTAPQAGPAPVPADVAARAAPARIAVTHGPGRVRVCGKNKGLGLQNPFDGARLRRMMAGCCACPVCPVSRRARKRYGGVSWVSAEPACV